MEFAESPGNILSTRKLYRQSGGRWAIIFLKGSIAW
jgi:hypothetical protein